MNIWTCCLLTVVIELTFLMLCGYRSGYEITVIICVNVISNLLLNLLVIHVFEGRQGLLEIPLEACVVALEYAVKASAFGRGSRLFRLTLIANMLSYGAGLVLTHLILH